MNKICAGIITYNPNISLLKGTVESLSVQVPLIIVVDNGSENIDAIQGLLSQKNTLRLVCNGENNGVATALNQIMGIAEQDGFKWVLTFDQDSILPNDYVSEMSAYIAKEHIAIVCPVIFDRNRRLVDATSKKAVKTSEEFVFVKKCITSGAITNVAVWNTVGKYDERLFIDGVDFDFCNRVCAAGYYILQVKNVVLNHSIGAGIIKRFLFLTVCLNNHNAIRKYYITRNRIYCDYKQYGYIPPLAFASNIKLLLQTLLFEPDKFAKVKSIVAGTRDGLRMVREANHGR